MERGSRLVALALTIILTGTLIGGCETTGSKKNYNVTGFIPYIANGLNEDYLPKEPYDGKGNLFRSEFK